jgi:hypothetical protein
LSSVTFRSAMFSITTTFAGLVVFVEHQRCPHHVGRLYGLERVANLPGSMEPALRIA